MSTAARRHPNTAHIPGGGPDGKTCRDCAFCYARPGGEPELFAKAAATNPNLKAKCWKWREMMAGTEPRPISPLTSACKYFRPWNT